MTRDIIQEFVDQKVPTRGKNKGRIAGEYGHIFYEGDILYDYGHHFPMLIRHKWGYLLNADKYSVTTSKHQGYCRSVATVQIPLSALRLANIPYDNFNLVDSHEPREDLLNYYREVPNDKAKTLTIQEYEALDWHKRRGWQPDNWEKPTKYYWHSSTKKEHISVKQFEDLPLESKFSKEEPIYFSQYGEHRDKESENYWKDTLISNYNGILVSKSEWHPNTERRPQHDVIEHNGRYFLSGMDGQNYFLCQLPEPVKTVDEAIEHLIPNDLRITRYDYDLHKNVTALAPSVVRQGEWFFEKHSTPAPIKESEWLKTHTYDLDKVKEIKAEIKQHNAGIKEYLARFQKNFVLPRGNDSSHSHTATRGALIDGIPYVMGTIRHSEHRSLKLSSMDKPVIYRAYMNRAVASYSAGGRVD